MLFCSSINYLRMTDNSASFSTRHNLCVQFVRFGFVDKPRGSFEKMAEYVVDPLMQPEIILTENDIPGA